MIDIHQHLIYGVDDGSKDLEMSLAMARLAAADGVERIVCSPHSNDVYNYPVDIINERLAELRHNLRGEIELSLACDFHITPENISEAVAKPFSYSIDGKGYLLIEFPNIILAPGTERVMFELMSAGYRLVITHPERYPFVHRSPHYIAQWLDQGCMLQLTAGALTGKFGAQCETLALELLDRDWVQFIATDAHNPDRRPPLMKEAFDFVAQRKGIETARRLCVVNPRSAVEGRPLGAQPEPIGLWNGVPLKFHLPGYKPQRRQMPGDVGLPPSAGKSFLKRFFGR